MHCFAVKTLSRALLGAAFHETGFRGEVEELAVPGRDEFLTKTVVHSYRGARPLFHALFGVKTLSETLFPVFNARG